jgi:hypothetical protein
MHTTQISKLAAFAHKRSQARGGQKFPLLAILDTLRGFEGSDPRDKVYAAPGFAGDIPCEQPLRLIMPGLVIKFSETWRSLASTRAPTTSGFLATQAYMALHICLPRGYRISCKAHVQCWGEKSLIFCSTPNLLMPFPKSVSRPGRFEEEVPLFDACGSKNPLWKQESYAKVKPSVKDCTLTVYGMLVDFIYSHHDPTLHMNKDDVDDLLSVGDQLPNYRPAGESFRSAYLRTMVADLKVQGQDVVGRGVRRTCKVERGPLCLVNFIVGIYYSRFPSDGCSSQRFSTIT